MHLEKISWRHFYVALSMLACALLLSACNLFADQPISVAAHVWLGYEPMFLARNEKWLDARYVRLVETRSATESIHALANGSVDAAALTLDETLKARAMGIPLSVVMVFNTSVGADMLVADSGIKSLGDLKGKRLGFEASSVGDVMLVQILQLAKLSRHDVQLVPVSIDQQLAAWQRKELDALITYEPVATQLLAGGAYKLFDTRQMPNTIVDVLAVRKNVLDRSHSKAIRHLISAHFRAMNHLKYNPQDAAYRMANHLGLDAQHVLGAYKGLLLPSAANNYRLLAEDSPPLLASATNLSALMVKNHLISQPDDLLSLIDAQYLPRDFEVTN